MPFPLPPPFFFFEGRLVQQFTAHFKRAREVSMERTKELMGIKSFTFMENVQLLVKETSLTKALLRAYWCWHKPFNMELDCLESNQKSLHCEKMPFITKLSQKTPTNKNKINNNNKNPTKNPTLLRVKS